MDNFETNCDLKFLLWIVCKTKLSKGSKKVSIDEAFEVELVSKELYHMAAILHVYAGGLNFMK